MLSTLSLWLCLPRGAQLYSALLVIRLPAVLEWIPARSLYVVLGWAWSGQRRANQLLEKLRIRQGELNRTLAALNEATWRLQQNGYELAEAVLRADVARRMKERFAAAISHELRTPLNLILGFSEMMHLSREVYGDMVWPATLRRDVRRIYEASRQLLSLVNDVLDLSRIDASEMSVRREPCDLAIVVQEAVSTISDLLRDRDLVLESKLPTTLPILRLDHTRILQVLLNLLRNAAEFTEEGSITVAAEVIEREVVVSVADTGMGIPADELARIFDEFHQVTRSLRYRQGGSGLGLAISKRFAQLHNGRMWAESELGKGSTFYLALPLPDAEVPLGRLAMRRAFQPQADNRERYLVVVDSDPGLSTLLTRQLADYRVLRAEDLRQASALADDRHALALVHNMPLDSADGEALPHDQLAELRVEVPIFSCAVSNQAWLARQAHVSGYLSKPISREELFSAIGALDGVQDILIVDDDQGFVQLVTRYLESVGPPPYKVRWAYQGAEALDLIQDRAPDAILLDLMMPEMDGYAFLGALRANQRTKDIPVLIVTATDSSADLLSGHHGVISLVRQQAFSTTEIIRYLQAFLSATVPVDPAGREPARSTVGSG